MDIKMGFEEAGSEDAKYVHLPNDKVQTRNGDIMLLKNSSSNSYIFALFLFLLLHLLQNLRIWPYDLFKFRINF